MRSLIKTIAPARSTQDDPIERVSSARWDVTTKIVEEAGGRYEVRIELFHIRESATDSSALPAIRGFDNPTDAAAYALAWVNAWTQANRHL